MFLTKRMLTIAVIGVSILTATASAQEDKKAGKKKLEIAKLGDTRNVHAFGEHLLCGQPSKEDLAEAKRRGIKTVITLRSEGEVDWDEAAAVKDLGLTFHQFGFRSPDSLTNKIFSGALKVLGDDKSGPVMLHCASANRVGAVWLAHRVLNDGLSVNAARQEAKTVGLRTSSFEKKALAYIQQQIAASEESVRPGINDRFRDPKLDVREWLGRFEIESREVFAAREDVLKACRIKRGNRVADIGAGTGFFSRLFADAAGANGWVYAVDIAPSFLQHISKKSQESQVTNLSCVLGSDRSIGLPPDSIDAAFICDTYHHFEYPQSTLASIYRALKPGGTLVVIDFERIPGKSREFILGHVRAGKDVFRGEIVKAGFKFEDEVKIPRFRENYLLRFRKE